MPLLDHFHPPLSQRRHWEAFHSRWASAIADELNDQGLPDHLFAEPTVTVGQVQVDVATLEEDAVSANGAKSVAALVQTAPTLAPAWVIPAVFAETFEVQVISSEGGPKLVAAIELVSPANKDRPQTRRAFAVKCASYLCQGISLIVIDIVTSRQANLHNEIMDLLPTENCRLAAEGGLYATSYHPVRRPAGDEIDGWHALLRLGGPLPTLPFHLGAEAVLQMNFETSYQETCRRLRLVG